MCYPSPTQNKDLGAADGVSRCPQTNRQEGRNTDVGARVKPRKSP